MNYSRRQKQSPTEGNITEEGAEILFNSTNTSGAPLIYKAQWEAQDRPCPQAIPNAPRSWPQGGVGLGCVWWI